jgi:uncharacterized membrane protein YgcG
LFWFKLIFGAALFGFGLGLVMFMEHHASGVKTTEEVLTIAATISAVLGGIPLGLLVLRELFCAFFDVRSNTSGTSNNSSNNTDGGYTSGGSSGGGDCGGGGDC